MRELLVIIKRIKYNIFYKTLMGGICMGSYLNPGNFSFKGSLRQPIDRKHGTQHHKCQRRRVVRQDTGLPGANDLAHGFLLFRELRPLYLP